MKIEFMGSVQNYTDAYKDKSFDELKALMEANKSSGNADLITALRGLLTLKNPQRISAVAAAAVQNPLATPEQKAALETYYKSMQKISIPIWVWVALGVGGYMIFKRKSKKDSLIKILPSV